MNSDDYSEIEQSQAENIFNAWIDSLHFEDVPEDFKDKWVSSYIEGCNEDAYDRWRDDQSD